MGWWFCHKPKVKKEVPKGEERNPGERGLSKIFLSQRSYLNFKSYKILWDIKQDPITGSYQKDYF